MNLDILTSKDLIPYMETLRKIENLIENMEPTKAKEWVSETEAMEILGGISKSTIQKFRKEGKLPWSQYRNLICYKYSDLMKFFEDHYTGNRSYVTSIMVAA